MAYKHYTVILRYESTEEYYIAHVTGRNCEHAAVRGLKIAKKANDEDYNFSVDFILRGHQPLEYRRDFDGDLDI